MRIFCGGTQCGELLGEVGASAAQMNPSPVWRIQPGWVWRQGILEMSDQNLSQQARLIHATWGRTDSRVGVAREANLPIVVRCPKCHGLRLVQPDVILRPVVIR